MSGFENWPAPILRRWLLSAAAGPVIFLIGLAGRIALHDPTLLTLSTLLASCMVVRCILLFRAIRHGDYETVEGVCVAIRRAPLGGHQHIRLMDDSGMKRFVKCFFELLTQIIVKVRKCKVQRVCVLHFQLAGSGGCFFLMKLYH